KVLRARYRQLPPLVALTANVIKDKHEYLDQGMDDAISKPLSVKAINTVIQALIQQGASQTEGQEPVIADESSLSEDTLSKLLDLEMLDSYVDIVGAQPVYDSLDMFEKMMPEYLAILDSNMTAKDKDGIKFEAH